MKREQHACDSQKWNEELERYSRGKYQDERMREMARKELVASQKNWLIFRYQRGDVSTQTDAV